jgi:hypothetical protein
VTPGEWDFLGDPDEVADGSFPHEDGGRSIDDPEVLLADGTIGYPTDDNPVAPPMAPTPAAAAPTAPAPTAPAPEPAPAPVVDPAVAAKAAQFDQLTQWYAADPSAFFRQMLENMPLTERAALLQSVGAPTAPVERLDIPSDPEGQRAFIESCSDVEQDYIRNLPQIRTIPELVKEAGAMKRSIQEQAAQLVPYINDTATEVQILRAQLDALRQAIGMEELPDPDPAIVRAAYQGGKATYKDAVRASVNYAPLVEAHRQKSAKRPTTPGNQSRRSEPVPDTDDMVALSRYFGANGLR